MTHFRIDLCYDVSEHSHIIISSRWDDKLRLNKSGLFLRTELSSERHGGAWFVDVLWSMLNFATACCSGCYQFPAWTDLSFPLVWFSSTPQSRLAAQSLTHSPKIEEQHSSKVFAQSLSSHWQRDCCSSSVKAYMWLQPLCSKSLFHQSWYLGLNPMKCI